MKTHTNTFKTNIKEFGRQIDCLITYTIDGTTTTLTNEELNSVQPITQGDLLKSIMKELYIDSNIDIPKDTEIQLQLGIYNYTNEQFEYIDFGKYYVTKSEYNEDTRSYSITCYDKMINSMVDYEGVEIIYPTTVRDYINELCNTIGLTFANASSTFANYDKEIPSDLYKDLGYTYRDVLDELAQVTASNICINANNQLEIKYITDTNDTVNEEYFSEDNVKFGKKIGKINSIVLSRSAESDNVYLRDEQSVTQNGLYEIKIVDNQIMNFNNRADFLPDILTRLDNLEFYSMDVKSTGICYYDICDRYTVSVNNNTYTCVLMNDEINIEQGIEENIYVEEPKVSETEYQYASDDDRKINKTWLIVNKQQGEIDAVVSAVENIEQDIQNPTSTKQGTSIDITDALDTPLIDFKMYGDTQQDTAILPSEYQQVEYIASNGQQYFNTEYIIKTNTRVVIDVQCNNTGTWIYGSRNGVNATNSFGLYTNSGSEFWAQIGGNGTDNGGTFSGTVANRNVIDINGTRIILNGTSMKTYTNVLTNGEQPFYLFGLRNSHSLDGRNLNGKIYSCKIYEGNTLVRDYIPCYRVNDNVIGFYDLVNNTFKTNAGTGTFTKGNNVTLPTPDYPQEIKVVTGDNTIEICGKNLFDNSKTSFYDYRTTLTKIDTGVRATITSVGNNRYSAIKLNGDLLLGKTIYISATITPSASNNGNIRLFYLNGNELVSRLPKTLTQTGSIFNEIPSEYPSGADGIAIVFSSNSNGTSVLGDYVDYTNVMVSIGEAIYEPYTGNSQLISLGVENLFDKNGILSNGYKKEDGTTGGTSSGNFNYTDYIPIQPNTTYTTSGMGGGRGSEPSRCYYDINKTFIRGYKHNNQTKLTDTSPSNAYYMIESVRVADLDTIQIEKGSKANSYSPYGASYIELNKISTYQDYIYKDNDRWFLHKEIGKVVLDGSEDGWENDSQNKLCGLTISDIIANTGTSTTIPSYCNYYRPASLLNARLYEYDFCIYGGKLWFNNQSKSLADFKIWVGSNNLIVEYPLNEATETEITNSELVGQLNALMSNPLLKGLNHITNETFNLYPNLFVEYFRDTSLNENFVAKEDMSKYYTKVETDAQIQINSSSIRQSVSELQNTVDNEGNAIQTISNQVNTLQTSTNLQISAINQTIENGVEKLNNSLVTIDANGINTSREDETFNTQITNKTFEVKDGTKELAFIGYDNDKQKTVARMDDLESKRATIGVHRCETLTRNYKKRTAWFYVGGDN